MLKKIKEKIVNLLGGEIKENTESGNKPKKRRSKKRSSEQSNEGSSSRRSRGRSRGRSKDNTKGRGKDESNDSSNRSGGRSRSGKKSDQHSGQHSGKGRSKKSADHSGKPGRHQSKKGSKKVVDPEAQLEAKRYDNPVASRTLLLETVTEGGTMTQSAIFEALQVSEEQEEGVSRRLNAMVRDGQLIRNRRGGYLPVDEKHFIRGHVIAHADGFGFMVPDEGGDDLFLSGKQMRGVLHGDQIIATVAGIDRRGRKEGSVISVVERANKTLIGRLFNDEGVAYIVPDNKRITDNILIPSDMMGDAEPGQIVKVEITSQPTKKRQAVARVIDIIGEHMAPGMEIEMAIHNHSIPYEFTEDVVAEADKFGDGVRDSDKNERLDLRDLPLLTIDGEDARDFDDAVFCEARDSADGEGKGWRLIVAIADVAHYVALDSALDKEAYERATSVYFPGRVIPMLPESLSNGLCSINPEVDRLCMVCEMFINSQGEVESYRFHEGLMRSHARLTYNKVAYALDNNGFEDPAFDAVYSQVVELHNMYQAMDGARKARGTIEFHTTETIIQFTDEKRIESIRPAISNVAHKIIEECMIAANVSAAKFIAKSKLPCLYRVHEEPADDRIEDLRGFLSELDLKLGAPSRKISSKDYAELGEQIKGRDDFHVIQTLMLRSMKQAIYKADNDGHFGLALNHYTHFTSPIRRYPDLLVHRAIKHIVRKNKNADYMYAKDRMTLMGEHCSSNERRANEATRDAEFALKCEYMMDKIGQEFDAHITGVVAFGLFVELDEYYVEGLIHITSLPKDYYVFEPKSHLLVGENHGLEFGLSDQVRIKVTRVDMDERKIDFELIPED